MKKSAINSEPSGLVPLGHAKEKYYEGLFSELIKTDVRRRCYDKNDVSLLVDGVGRLALNIASCSQYLIKRSSSKEVGIKILRDIFDGKVGDHAYNVLVQSGEIVKERYVIDEVLRDLYGKDDLKFEESLRYLKAIPKDFESKRYYKHHMDFCRMVAAEMKECVIEKCKEELQRDSGTKVVGSSESQKAQRRVRFV